MSAAAKIEYLELLEEKRRRLARNDLNHYCRYIEIPGVPVNDDEDCEEFYPDTVVPAEHHELINNALMKVDAGKIKRLMLFMPPGSAKSTYGSVTWPTFFMGRHPGKNIITTSYGDELAKKFGRKCRSITRSPEYEDLFDTGLVQDNRAVDDWALLNGSTFMSGGILSGITGNRADGLVIDDPVKGRENADSPTIRNKTWEAYLTDLRTRLKPNGWIVIIQTRWHEDDLAGRILPESYDGESGWIQARDGEEWFVLSLQAQAERDDDPLGRKRGEWLWTDWFTPAHWRQERKTQGERNWSALYQQRPKPLEGSIIKRRWANRYTLGDLPPDFYLVHSWDTANKPDEILNAPSVCTVWAVSKLGYYLVFVWRDWVDYPTLKKQVERLYQDYPANAVLVEDKASGQSLIQDLRDGSPVPVIAIEPDGGKMFRAEQSSGAWESGFVFLPSDDPAVAPPWLMEFEREIFAFPLSTYADQVDSMSQAVRYMHRNRAGTGLIYESAGRMTGHQSGA